MLDKIANHIADNKGKLAATLILLFIVMAMVFKMPAFDGSFKGFILGNNPYFLTSKKIDSIFTTGKPVYLKVTPGKVACNEVLKGTKQIEDQIHIVVPNASIISIRPIVSAFIPPELRRQDISETLKEISIIPMFQDLISKDKKSFLLVLTIVNDSLFNYEGFNRLLENKYTGIEQVKAISIFHIEHAIGDSIKKDILLLSTFICLFFSLFILYAYRDIRSLLFALIIIVAVIYSSLFFLSILDYNINLITVLTIPVITVISLSDVIHLLNGYNHLKGAHNETNTRIKEVVKLYIVPSFFSSATTAVAFFSFYFFNDTVYIKQFGLVTGIILMFEFVIIFLLAPFLIQFIHTSLKAPPLFATTIRFFEKHQKGFTIILITFMVSSFALVGTLKYHTDLVMFFPNGSTIKSLHEEFTNDFYSQITGDILIERIDNATPVTDSTTRAIVAAITKKVAENEHISSVGSITNDYTLNTTSGFPVSLLSVLGKNNPFISRDGKYFRIILKFKNAKYINSFNETFTDIIRPYTKDFHIYFTSPAVILEQTDANISSSLFNSLFSSGFFIAIILFLFTRSFFLTFISLIPNLVPLAGVIYVFYLANLNINILTAITAVVCLGLLDDDTVHILYRKLILKKPLGEVSVSILSTSVLLAGGFGMFAFSSFRPTQVFGLISAFVFLVGVVSELTILPYLAGLQRKWKHEK